MNDKIKLSAKVQRRKKIKKIAKLALLILLLLLLVVYIAISIIYNSGNFTITLDKNLYFDRSLIIYDDPDYKVFRAELYAKSIEYFDNISYKWLPDDLDNSNGGSNNGENFVAYTFFIENKGEDITDYWYEIIIADSIKGVDEAMRIRVYKNGKPVTYAKISKKGVPEENTKAFVTDTLVVRDNKRNFKPGDIDKFTVVIWLEGSDPECTDNILGGEVKIHMDFKSEIIENKGE